MEGLKKCPFCGGEAKIKRPLLSSKLYGVVCANKDCIISGIGIGYFKKEQAIEAWNRRCCE